MPLYDLHISKEFSLTLTYETLSEQGLVHHTGHFLVISSPYFNNKSRNYVEKPPQQGERPHCIENTDQPHC